MTETSAFESAGTDSVPVLAVRLEPRGSSITVRVVGDIDLSTVSVLEAELRKAFAGNDACGDVVVDLAGVRFMGALGLTALLEASHDVASAGGTLSLTRTTPMVRRLLNITGLEDALPVL